MSLRFLLIAMLGLLGGAGSAFAAADGEAHQMPLYAPRYFDSLPINNSMVMAWLAVGLIVLFCRMATKEMKLVPSGLQNFAEWVIESLYNFFEGLLGPHLVKRTFWFLGSLFCFILVSNFLGLVPLVGTAGIEQINADGEKRFLPFLRGANADLNLTASMAITFAILWFYWAISENGLKGFLAHIFAPKGNFGGLMLVLMTPVFLFVGVLEVISIAIRPVALSFRLYGNMYGGEQTMEILMGLLPWFLGFLPAIPFFFMKLLIGFVQALVFTLLCAVFIKLTCDHGEEEHH